MILEGPFPPTHPPTHPPPPHPLTPRHTELQAQSQRLSPLHGQHVSVVVHGAGVVLGADDGEVAELLLAQWSGRGVHLVDTWAGREAKLEVACPLPTWDVKRGSRSHPLTSSTSDRYGCRVLQAGRFGQDVALSRQVPDPSWGVVSSGAGVCVCLCVCVCVCVCVVCVPVPAVLWSLAARTAYRPHPPTPPPPAAATCLPLCTCAQDFADGTLDFVVFDGHVTYEDNLRDLEAWTPKVGVPLPVPRPPRAEFFGHLPRHVLLTVSRAWLTLCAGEARGLADRQGLLHRRCGSPWRGSHLCP